MNACDACLTRAELIRLVGPHVARMVRPHAQTRLLLAQPDRELIDAVAGTRAEEIAGLLEDFDPETMREQARSRDLLVVCRHDPAYPEGLHQLSDPPYALFLRGSPAVLHDLASEPAVAIVGARRASGYATEIAHELGRGLATCGVSVVSGLALGVDGAAHRGALAGGGRPLAVLGSGADVPYPKRHSSLYAGVARSGAVISEMPPGTPARAWAFPARNRIMAALAEMVIVVEAQMGSGTLITAEFAGDLGRQIGAVPGRVNAQGAALPNKLIADGAKPILAVQDVLDALYGVGERPAPPPIRVSLDGPTRAVLRAVEDGDSPLGVREVHIKDIRAALGRLEVLGLVRRDGLGGYERTGLQCEHA